MPYDLRTRAAALDCLAAQQGDFRRTSAATGISESTLRRWARQPQARREPPVSSGPKAGRVPPARTDSAQQQLEELVLDNLLEDARQLSESLQEVIDEAPLGQRATALNQLLDKILKILALLPRREEVLVRVEFQDPDGSAHQAPPWARNDSGQQGAL